jgi:hypothetical protein
MTNYDWQQSYLADPGHKNASARFSKYAEPYMLYSHESENGGVFYPTNASQPLITERCDQC